MHTLTVLIDAKCFVIKWKLQDYNFEQLINEFEKETLNRF